MSLTYQYKGSGDCNELSHKPSRMSHLISERAKSRSKTHFATENSENAPPNFKAHPSPLRLDYGTPNAGFFPINSIKVDVKDYPFEESKEYTEFAGIEKAKEHEEVIVEKHLDDKQIIDLATGLQYSLVSGIAPLHQFTKDVIRRTNNPAYEEWDTILSTGAGDGLNKAIDVFLDEGEVVLLEEFTFTPILQSIQNAGAIAVPIKLKFGSNQTASNGIDLEYLEDLLENWDQIHPELKGRKPKALYTISSGQNPTGLTQSLQFRKNVYSLAQSHDFAIIEDDPYGYLTLEPYRSGIEPQDWLSLSSKEYLENHLIPSYITIDTDGRVLRVETFSKLFAPGLRLGFLVGHKKVIEAIEKYANIVTRSTSGASQLLLNNIIQQKFKGVDGWLEWVLKLRKVYTDRRNVLLRTLYELKAFEAGQFAVVEPKAGMFVSVIVNFPQGTDVANKIDLLDWKFRAYGVGVVTGLKMAVDKQFSLARGNFFRLTYAPANSLHSLAEGAERFTRAISDFFEAGLEF